MTRFRRLICLSALAACATAAFASAASAATFYVNKRSGENVAKCGVWQGGHPGEGPCLTIAYAVKRAEASPAPNTIELSAEENPYEETVELLKAADNGLTIDGEEPGVIIKGKGPALLAHFAGSATVSNLKLEAGTGGVLRSAVATSGDALTLSNVAVLNEVSGGEDGVKGSEGGSVTMNGGTVEMENGATGWAVTSVHAPLVLNGVKIVNGAASSDPAGGINSEHSSLSVSNTHISVEEGEPSAGIATGRDSAVSIQNVAVHLPSYRGHIHYEEIHMAEKRRKFDQDFRDGAVRIVLDSGRPIAEVAREMGIDDGTLGNWVKKAREKHKPGALKEDERSELNRLRREVKELRMQRDVLKRSVVLWVDEAMGRTR